MGIEARSPVVAPTENDEAILDRIVERGRGDARGRRGVVRPEWDPRIAVAEGEKPGVLQGAGRHIRTGLASVDDHAVAARIVGGPMPPAGGRRNPPRFDAAPRRI